MQNITQLQIIAQTCGIEILSLQVSAVTVTSIIHTLYSLIRAINMIHYNKNRMMLILNISFRVQQQQQ